MTPSDVSVIIPTLNESLTVVNAIESARRCGAEQIIVADGGSQDETVELARSNDAFIVDCPVPGRGIQLARGVEAATGQVVLFLHADNQLHQDCLQQICHVPDRVWGAFEHRIDSERTLFRLIERGNAARVRFRSMAFGDQAMFVRRDQLDRIGGIAEIPLLEDVDLSQRLSKIAKPVLLPGPVKISPRRWEQRGVIMQTLRNWSFQLRYAMGASAETLAKKY